VPATGPRAGPLAKRTAGRRVLPTMMATARKGLPLACQCLLGTTVSLSKGIVQARPRRSGFFFAFCTRADLLHSDFRPRRCLPKRVRSVVLAQCPSGRLSLARCSPRHSGMPGPRPSDSHGAAQYRAMPACVAQRLRDATAS